MGSSAVSRWLPGGPCSENALLHGRTRKLFGNWGVSYQWRLPDCPGFSGFAVPPRQTALCGHPEQPHPQPDSPFLRRMIPRTTTAAKAAAITRAIRTVGMFVAIDRGIQHSSLYF